MTPVEPSCKQHHMDSLQEKVKILYLRSCGLPVSPFTAFGSVFCSSAASCDSSCWCPAYSSRCGIGCFCCLVFGPLGFVISLGRFFFPVVGHRSPEPWLVPVWSLSVPAPAARGSQSCHPSSTRSCSRVPSATWSRSQASFSTCLASSDRSGSTWSSSKLSRVSSLHPSLSQDCSSLRSRARSPAWVQVSSFECCTFCCGVSFAVELCLVLYSTRTPYRGLAPSVAASHAGSCTRSRSPVSKHSRSWTKKRSHSYQSPAANAGSSREELLRESSYRSCRLRSPSSASSRGGSSSPDSSRCRSCSCLPVPSRCEDEDYQEEQSLLDFVLVVATLRSLNQLSEDPSESRKIRGFHVVLKDDDQPASSYHLPVGSASGKILMYIEDWISSPSSGKHLKKVSKLLPCPGVHSRHFYRFEEEETAKTLNHHVT